MLQCHRLDHFQQSATRVITRNIGARRDLQSSPKYFSPSINGSSAFCRRGGKSPLIPVPPPCHSRRRHHLPALLEPSTGGLRMCNANSPVPLRRREALPHLVQVLADRCRGLDGNQRPLAEPNRRRLPASGLREHRQILRRPQTAHYGRKQTHHAPYRTNPPTPESRRVWRRGGYLFEYSAHCSPCRCSGEGNTCCRSADSRGGGADIHPATSTEASSHRDGATRGASHRCRPAHCASSCCGARAGSACDELHPRGEQWRWGRRQQRRRQRRRRLSVGTDRFIRAR